MKAALLLLVGLAILFESQGQTTIITVTARAYFSDLVGGKNMTACRPAEDIPFGGPSQPTCTSLGYTIPPPEQGRWGRPATSFGKSGLGFTPIQNKIVATDTDFYLGSLTHFNFPIYDAANGTTLNVIFLVKDSDNIATLANYTYKFPMLVDETPNSPPCPYPGTFNCSDKISFLNKLNLNQSFTLGAVDYTLRLIGFKESNSSSSVSVDYFISNEYSASEAYLFARITAACPRSCVNGGAPILYNNQECKCNCSTATCNPGQIFTSNCGCTCPDLGKCNNGNGGILDNSTCNCNCNQCTPPLILNPNDCSCTCPQGYCNSGYISDPNTCACTCPTASCPIQNEVRDGRCNCVCTLQCPAKYKEDPNPSVCGCICANSTCNAGFSIDNNCNCQCTKTCPNGQALIAQTCTCGNCVGNWVQDNNGLCLVCPLSQASCSQTETFDSTLCACICNNLHCDLNTSGLVIDSSKPCACRPCVAGECQCGNGIVEVGEQCDTGNIIDPCCKNCTFVRAPCDDGNGCTSGDTCNGTGVCIGDYKCAPSTECNKITCNTSIGICENIWLINGTACGGTTDLCAKRCLGGLCNNDTVKCSADNNTIDCMAPICNSGSGICTYQPITGNGCTDQDPCTSDDVCTNGLCKGTPIVCPKSTDPCKVSLCVGGICAFQPLSGVSCNADNSSCTPNDQCVKGVCLPGEKVVCNSTDVCKIASCDPNTGSCISTNVDNAQNKTCNDQNFCTFGDACIDGSCVGTIDPSLAQTPPCGVLPPSSVANNTVLILSIAGAAALIGAIAGMAFLIRRIRQSKLMDPDTWNPDAFSSVGANPLYKGSEKIVDNRLYEGGN